MPNTNKDKRKLDRDKCPKKLQEKIAELERKKEKEKADRKNYTVVTGDEAQKNGIKWQIFFSVQKKLDIILLYDIRLFNNFF